MGSFDLISALGPLGFASEPLPNPGTRRRDRGRSCSRHSDQRRPVAMPVRLSFQKQNTLIVCARYFFCCLNSVRYITCCIILLCFILSNPPKKTSGRDFLTPSSTRCLIMADRSSCALDADATECVSNELVRIATGAGAELRRPALRNLNLPATYTRSTSRNDVPRNTWERLWVVFVSVKACS